MSHIHSIWEFVIRKRCWVVVLFFAAMIGFVDENSLWDRHKRIQEIEALRMEKNGYENRYKEDTKALEELDANREAVVRLARERYLMKYPDEDVYVFMDVPQVDDESKMTEDVDTVED